MSRVSWTAFVVARVVGAPRGCVRRPRPSRSVGRVARRARARRRVPRTGDTSRRATPRDGRDDARARAPWTRRRARSGARAGAVMVSEARGDGTGGTPFDDASGDDADDGVREALRAVDDALKFASAAWCDVESVRVLVREVAALRRMAGVEDVRFVDEDGDEVDRELRLETAWARCRVRVAEAEALALRREAEGAKEKFRETFGDDASEWLQALRVKVDVWEDEMTSRMRGLSTI